MMKKKVTTIALAAVLAGVALVGGSLAYFQDSDADQNVMVAGNVKIEQIEQQRDANGAIVDFDQEKKLAPVTADTFSGYHDTNVTVNGWSGLQLFSTSINAVDKFVSVENTGTEEAYIRTVFAFEMLNDNGKWIDPVNTILNTVTVAGLDGKGLIWPKDAAGNYLTIDVNGTKYIVAEYYYGYESKLAAGKISHPSLMQVYLTKNTGNEFYAQCGGEYDILVISQAVQTQGFTGAKTALDTAFGAVDATNATKWFTEANYGA